MTRFKCMGIADEDKEVVRQIYVRIYEVNQGHFARPVTLSGIFEFNRVLRFKNGVVVLEEGEPEKA